MFDRQTTHLAKAALLLHTIKANRDDLDLVLELQRFLIRRITQTERRVNRVSRAAASMRRSLSRDRLPRERAKKVKARIKDCGDVVDGLRYLMFVWRCFGDGVAAAYQSKYALKHLYYDANYNVKENAGFMTGKAGFRREWKLLNMGIRMGVPVVLADVTNIVRHGDLCALAGEDPVPIEVKSSKNRNARTARQISQLQELASFYANDGAEAFRGMGTVRRMELRLTEVNHEEAANECLAKALEHGFASIEPEPGLRYVAFTKDPGSRLTGLFSPTIQPYGLVPSPDWLPAYPFTLSLIPGNLVPFLLGHVAMVVLIDLALLKSLFAQHGVHATMIMEDLHSVQVCKDPADLQKGVFRVSQHRFGRIAGEFQSLAWFAEDTARSIAEVLPAVTTAEELEAMKAEPNGGWQNPSDWYAVRDCFDTYPPRVDNS
jgi:Holliday junction resolvase